MGLDSYFKIKTYETPEFSKDISLCGGLCSSNGSDGSFRGKIYDHIIAKVTSGKYTLYENELSPEQVKDISFALQNHEYLSSWNEESNFNVSPEEYKSLQKLFKEAVEKECVLIGWW